MSRKKDKQVYFVTYPRSGHHALIKFLDDMAGISDDYCEFYNCINSKGEIRKCIYENHNWVDKYFRCGAGKRLLKCHDFDLGLPIRSEALYIVQYRHPFNSIRSWYELELSGTLNIPSWDIYLRLKLDYWLKFIQKWVQGNLEMNNFIFIKYEDLGDKEKLENIVRFIGNDVRQQLESGYFSEKRSLLYADSNEIKTLRLYEEKISPILELAGINKLFNDSNNYKP